MEHRMGINKYGSPQALTSHAPEKVSLARGTPPTGAARIPSFSGAIEEPLLPWGNVSNEEWNNWRWQWKNRLRSITQLAEFLGLNPARCKGYAKLIKTYHYAITPYYISLIDWSNPHDPIRLQALPDLKEIECTLNEQDDPLEEERHTKVPGLLHRYPDRALAIVTNTCAVYCRHCMRKRLWKCREGECSSEALGRMVDYVARTPGVREVIVSGGDPLTMNMEKLDWLLGALRAIPHVEVLRIGSRIPVVLPMRIDETLCTTLEKYRPLWLNTQFNHPREVTPEAARACDMLLHHGIPVSNQSVLLRGVNDSVEVMRSLCYALQRISVRPYYLFQCDPARGAGHFQTSIWTGIEIIEQMRRYHSGLSIPMYVVDTPGKEGKIPLEPYYLVPCKEGVEKHPLQRLLRTVQMQGARNMPSAKCGDERNTADGCLSTTSQGKY